jgi:hypothetical protein
MDGFDRMQVDTDLEQLLNPEFDLELPALGDNITDLIGPPQPGASGMRFQHTAAICFAVLSCQGSFLAGDCHRSHNIFDLLRGVDTSYNCVHYRGIAEVSGGWLRQLAQVGNSNN